MIRILKYGEVTNSEIFARAEATVDVASIVSGIIDNVRANGDRALLEYSEKFDKVQLGIISRLLRITAIVSLISSIVSVG